MSNMLGFNLLQPVISFETILVIFAGLLGGVVVLVVLHYDGRALFTARRPDLETRPGIPLLGNLVEIRKNSDLLLNFWTQALKEKKDPNKRMSFTVPGRRIIDASRPEYIQYIQKDNFQNYVKGPIFFDTVQDVLGGGIFAVDGPAWHAQRKASSRIFTGKNFRGIISQTIDHDLKTLVKVIGHHADRGEVFALDKLFFRFTLSSFSHMTFGQPDVGALESGKPVPFAEAFDQAQTLLDRRFNNPFWKITELLNGDGARMREAVKILDDFSYGIIDAREKEGLGNVGADQKKEAVDLLSLYMALRDENGQPMTRRQLRDAVLNLIIAGRDTTAQALSWTFFHLLTQGDKVLDPVRKEASEVGVVDYDTWRSLTQTNAVFMEGLRLHPSVPKNGWLAQADDVIPNGPIVKKGDTIFWSDWLMARNEDIWGPDAKQFNPARWIDSDGALVKESQWKAHMFNGGYRLCLGQDLAKFEAVAVLANLLREFDFSFAPDYLENIQMMPQEDTPRFQPSLTLPMKAPLMVRATRRQRV